MCKNVKRKAGMVFNRGYKDGLCGVCSSPSTIPPQYRKTYHLGHTKGMIDSGQLHLTPLHEVA